MIAIGISFAVVAALTVAAFAAMHSFGGRGLVIRGTALYSVVVALMGLLAVLVIMGITHLPRGVGR